MTKPRNFARHSLKLDVRLRVEGDWHTMVSSDVSRTGMLLESDVQVSPQQIAQLHVSLPSGVIIECMGRVRRVDESAQAGSFSVGLEFFVMSRESQAQWDALIDEVGQSGSPRQSTSIESATSGGNAPFVRRRRSSSRMELVDTEASRNALSVLEALSAPTSGDTPAISLMDYQSEAVKIRSRVRSMRKATDEPQASAETQRTSRVSNTRQKANPESRSVTQAWKKSPEEINGGATLINLRPKDIDQLLQVVNRRVKGERLFLRTSERHIIDQTVDFALVHPLTDAEWMVSGKVQELVPASASSAAGIVVKFGEITAHDRALLSHFVQTGRVPSVGRTVQGEGDDPVDIAWALITSSSQPQAGVAQLMKLLTKYPDDARIHVALAVGNAVIGENPAALAFGQSAMQLLRES